MNDKINYQNNPLHALGLKELMVQLEQHYGYEILKAYLNLNCFGINASIASSVKFLKKTEWAREKVETFYLYQFKNLPKAPFDQLDIPPRDRIIPDGQVPGEPAVLTVEDAENVREKKAKLTADHGHNGGRSPGRRRNQPIAPSKTKTRDPWANWRK